MPQPETFLVTGASGQLGRLVLDALLTSGEKRLVATTRTPETLAAYAKMNVDVRPADFSQPEGLAEAFAGATCMLLISTHEPGARLGPQLAALEAARAAGVRHIFYTSHAAPETSVSVVAPDHAVMEQAIRESGATYTFLRNYLYADILLQTLPDDLRRGAIHGAAGDAKLAYVTRRDCAEAAAGAMRNAAAHENRIYDITGPRGYSHSDVARIVSEILARPFTYVDMSPEDYRAMLLKEGLPEAFADAYVSFELSHSLGELAFVTDAAQMLSGHPPETLETFLGDNLLSSQAPANLEKYLRSLSV